MRAKGGKCRKPINARNSIAMAKSNKGFEDHPSAPTQRVLLRHASAVPI